ncbi:tripartite tricarboxylate transporter substrate binding protein [Pseudorhodoplanes sp.]|uniref:Bug family tripartite tricarboxylate transporter substrate binding protein n=1 Tax=Pseudorhodoplanes sp. TaxID=1934341 RepID=UPI002B591652|nr:tripartite tricarboxylate transporter substrate binding protein [Pseudorhodoplanes sp.]HWV54035.1 tripartite tricarboxylate transporter substrate binding protein [Pseudorhodoplanes sp.]
MPKILAALAAAAAVTFASSGASAQQGYPNQLVRIVVPFSAGSATDLLARAVADKLGEKWKQQVIVENRPGIAGTATVAKSPADGYTLMLTSNGHTVAGVLNKNLQFDPVKDFAGITPVASVPLVLIVNPELPTRTLKEFIELAKSKPGTLNFASPGLGSTTFIAGALFKDATKLDLVHVPYKGAPEANMSVVRGDAQMYFTPASTAVELVQTGKVRALGVATDKRVASMPDVPTMKEAGLPGFTYESWFGLMAPAGTPAAIIEKINKDTIDALQDKALQDRMAKQGGVVVVTSTPKQFDETIKTDTARYSKIFQDAGIAAK